MIDKFEKKKNCDYCGKDLEAKYRSKRFCNTKCRVYFSRENKDPKIGDIVNITQKVEIASIKKVNNATTVTLKEVKKHPLWKDGDQQEGSNSFYLKYGCWNYNELEQLKKQ